jgi:hypothetical protein
VRENIEEEDGELELKMSTLEVRVLPYPIRFCGYIILFKADLPYHKAAN